MDSDKLVNLDRTLDLTSFRHLCCIYDNVNDYMEVITNIIKNGLDANERIFYSGDFENTDLVLKHLLSMGINVEGLISKGQLGLNVFELKRICNDFVDTAQIISMLDSEVQKAFSMGFKGLRVIGEMSFAKACNFSTSEIIEHEAKIDDFANKKNKSSVFCLFNKNLFPPSIILEDVIEYTVDILNKRISKIFSASIYFIEDNYAVLNAQKGYTEHYLNHFTNIPYPEGFTWRTLEEEKSIYVSDTSNDSSILNIGKKMGIKSYISTPIIISGKTLGTLTINSLHSEAFDQDEINLLNMISSLIVNAVNKKEIKNKII